jgi:hypothetical protein
MTQHNCRFRSIFTIRCCAQRPKFHVRTNIQLQAQLSLIHGPRLHASESWVHPVQLRTPHSTTQFRGRGSEAKRGTRVAAVEYIRPESSTLVFSSSPPLPPSLGASPDPEHESNHELPMLRYMRELERKRDARQAIWKAAPQGDLAC